MDEPKLKPCPFCGEMERVRVRWGQVRCERCGAEGPEADDEDPTGVVDAWNLRSEPKPERPK